MVEKKIQFQVLCEGCQKWGCFRIFCQLYLALGTNFTQHAIFLAVVFVGN